MRGRNRGQLIEAYVSAREEVVASGYGHEIDWQAAVQLSSIEESDFLREAAWVILNSGLSERVVRGRFPKMTAAFLGWSSAETIVAEKEACRSDALRAFDHRGKVNAIVSVATAVCDLGFEGIRDRVSTQGVEYLGSLDFIGPVTRFHLAKNIGLDVVKPDRHLTRVAQSLRVGEPRHLCEFIAAETGDRLSVVDLVLWRFATIRPDYVAHFVPS